MFCHLVVLVKLSVLAKWLARKTPLRKPNRGEGIVSRKLRPKSVHDFLGLLYCFIVLLCICVVFCPYVTYYPTVMAWYSLFMLKVPLNTKQTNKPTFIKIIKKYWRWVCWQLADGNVESVAQQQQELLNECSQIGGEFAVFYMEK